MNILILAILFFSFPAVFAEQKDIYSNYLAKIIDRPDFKKAGFFKYQNLTDQKIITWLDDLDRSLDTGFVQTYDADFFVAFAKDGSVAALEIEELRERDFEKFKDFIAEFLSLKFNPLVDGIAEGSIFNLDASLLYVERSPSLPGCKQSLSLRGAEGDVAIQFNEDSESDPSFAPAWIATSPSAPRNDGLCLQPRNDRLCLQPGNDGQLDKIQLISPQYIDNPALGETIKFYSKNLNAYIQARVIESENNQIKVFAESMIPKDNPANPVLLNLTFNVERPKSNSSKLSEKFLEVISSALLAAMQVSPTAMVASNGYLPGALAILGMGGAVLQEADQTKSFLLSKGDEVIVKIKGNEK